ncbi:MAG: DegT/DnrJ/EryC1/StrS family aminotransferase, partial [Candidatus Omnitrophica bacterium]|nr:DegT/DnrJ/EryC1/StrS family aminotransferase [Candidatus Omnitrophota bacterium]
SAAFSFFPTKNLGALGDAGCVTAQDDEVAQRLALLRVHGSKQRYIHEVVGGNYRIDALQSAFLSVKIESAQSWIDRRIDIADSYSAALKKIDAVTVPSVLPGYRHSFHQYTIQVPDEKRNDLIAHLDADGIGSMPYYPLCVHLQPALFASGWRQGDFPEAEQCSLRVISLPMYPELKEEEISAVTASVQSFFNR